MYAMIISYSQSKDTTLRYLDQRSQWKTDSRWVQNT